MSQSQNKLDDLQECGKPSFSDVCDVTQLLVILSWPALYKLKLFMSSCGLSLVH